MAIDKTQIRSDIQMDLMTRTLQNQLQQEVEEEIKSQVMPRIEAKIKDMAKEAVGKWAINMSTQKDMTAFGNVDKIMVQFIENVIHQNAGPTIKIEEK